VPFWDIKAAVKEVERAKTKLELRGIAMCPEPHIESDLPDIQNRHWDPLWEVCSDLNVPINFHIGASPASDVPLSFSGGALFQGFRALGPRGAAKGHESERREALQYTDLGSGHPGGTGRDPG
jgi:hypothetical protein